MRVCLSQSSYYYQKAVSRQEDTYRSIRRKITKLFHENAGRYGYRRIRGLLKREGIPLSEKAVRRLMQEEGLFGRLKNEMFCNRDWTGVSIQEFIDILNEYLIWDNEKKIKISLGNMSSREYRQSFG